jgi:hypothetical protein
MSQNSETMMQTWRRASPVDSLAAVAGIVCAILASVNPDAFERVDPAQMATAIASVGTIGALFRAWWRARRRRRRQRLKG